MYSNFIFKKTGMGILIIFVSAGILIAGIFLNQESFNAVSESRQLLIILFCIGLYIPAWWYAFWRIFINIKIEPDIGAQKRSLQEVKTSFANYFSQAKTKDGQYFEVTEIDNELQVSWSRTIDFKQIVSYGSDSVNYKVSFIFDEKRNICGIHTSILRISKNVGILGLFYSMSWSGGVLYEVGESYTPSYSLEGGNMIMDIEKLSYNNATIIDPAIEILKMSGWTSSFLMLKHKVSRIIYSILGWILLIISVALIAIGSLGFFDDSNVDRPGTMTSNNPVENISYIASVYNDEELDLSEDKTYTDFLHNKEADRGIWYVKDNNLVLEPSSDYGKVDGKVLQIKDGVFYSNEYVSVPDLASFKDFNGISKDVFVISDITPIYKISDSAYSSTSGEYLISISKTNNFGSFERVGEYRCLLQQKTCSKTTIFSDADVAFDDVYKKINDEVELSLKNNKLDHLDVPLSSVNWRIWKSETGQLLGNMTYSGKDSLKTVGLIYNIDSKNKSSKVDGFDLASFSRVFNR